MTNDDEPLSQRQWTLYFWLELCSLWPHVPRDRALALARRTGALAGVVPPEQAAAALAIGLGGMSIH